MLGSLTTLNTVIRNFPSWNTINSTGDVVMLQDYFIHGNSFRQCVILFRKRNGNVRQTRNCEYKGYIMELCKTWARSSLVLSLLEWEAGELQYIQYCTEAANFYEIWWVGTVTYLKNLIFVPKFLLITLIHLQNLRREENKKNRGLQRFWNAQLLRDRKVGEGEKLRFTSISCLPLPCYCIHKMKL